MAAAPRFFVSAPRVILYDGVCNLCNSGIRFVARRDVSASINFCAVQSSQAQPYLDVCRLTREEVLQQFVFIQGDRFSRASTAALDVAGHLKFPWPLARIFLAVPLPVRDAVYDYVAFNRCQTGVCWSDALMQMNWWQHNPERMPLTERLMDPELAQWLH
ncbi:Uncharacterized protein YuxK [Coccomyxa sp. Obi]|nr:Uncharacterized protein YuxK [Coccomyxa sp. Obi]